MSDFKFKNGAELKDVITGFRGIVVGRSDFITGCRQYCLRPKGLQKEGKPKPSNWFDEDRLKKVGKGITLNPTKKPPKRKSPPGGTSLEGYPDA